MVATSVHESFVSSSPMAAAIVRGHDLYAWTYTWMSRRFVRWLGLDDGAAAVGRLVDDETAQGAAVARAVQRARDDAGAADGAPVVVELDVAHEARVFAVTAFRIADGDDVGVIIIDITELKRANDERNARERVLRATADGIPQMVMVGDATGITFVNRRMRDYLGDDVSPDQSVHPDDRAAVDDALARFPANETLEVEHRMRRRDGVYRWFLLRVVRVDMGDGTRFMGTATDIDEMKATQRRLEEIAELRERIIGIVAHDLKNPVHAVALAAGMLQHKERAFREVQRIAGRIASSAGRMASVIDDLLDYARSRAGGAIPIERAPTDLADVLRQVVDESRLVHPDRRIDVTCDDATGLWDATRLAQLVSNLIDNALKYGQPAAPVAVRVRSDGDDVALEVHNEGPPIAADALPHVFEPMKRASAKDPSRSGASLGLGLYIVREIARAHGGDVDVTSSASAGTTFTVRLPRR